MTENLFTLALLAYNQEQYVRDAIAGVLAQTWSPLEIILSDDYSSDRTFEIIRAEARRYRGPSTLIVRRNDTNVGVCEHVNRIFRVASGRWIVLAAGDDVSLPERVARIAHCVERAPDLGYVLSSAYRFSGAGSPTHDRAEAVSTYIGGTEAIRADIFHRFGPLRADTFNEDWSFFFRAQLLAAVGFIEEPLVFYRVSEQGLTSDFYSRPLSGMLDVHERNLRQFAVDLQELSGRSHGWPLLAEINDRLAAIAALRASFEQPRRSRTKLAQRYLTAGNPLRPERAAVGALTLWPQAHTIFRRLDRSRFARLSPVARALAYVNPRSLLKPPAKRFK